MASRNGTLNGSDQNAPAETFTAQAPIIAPTTAHAASGVSRPKMRPTPPAVSAVDTKIAANVGSPPAAGLHEADGGAEVEELDEPGLNHRGADADTQDQQAEIGQCCRGFDGGFGGRHGAEGRGL